MGLDIHTIVQYATAVGAVYALYEILYKQAKWRTEADAKLQTIDVTWKPQVNQRLDIAEERLGTIDKSLIEQNQEILKELRQMNASMATMDKHLALAVQSREHLEERVKKLESPPT